MSGLFWWTGAAIWGASALIVGAVALWLLCHAVQTTIFVWRARRAVKRDYWWRPLTAWWSFFTDPPAALYGVKDRAGEVFYWPGPRGWRQRAKDRKDPG